MVLHEVPPVCNIPWKSGANVQSTHIYKWKSYWQICQKMINHEREGHMHSKLENRIIIRWFIVHLIPMVRNISSLAFPTLLWVMNDLEVWTGKWRSLSHSPTRLKHDSPQQYRIGGSVCLELLFSIRLGRHCHVQKVIFKASVQFE